MIKKAIYPRHIEPRLKEALKDSPVVLIQGSRQCGKTTLAQAIERSADYKYLTFDDENTRIQAVEDPLNFVNSLSERVILDEAQRAPEIFSSIKLSVDRDRTAGRFILTGSVNLLQTMQIKESLAGRMDILRLHPFSQNELQQTTPQFPDLLFSPDFSISQDLPSKNLYIDRIVTGGYPTALKRSKTRRHNWYRTYIESIVNSDARIISGIRSIETLPRLLEIAAGRTACLLNVNNLTSSFQLDRLTIDSYLILLEKMFLMERIPAWHSNRAKRLVKTPKMHLCDTGIVCALLDLNEAALLEDRMLFGHILETFVLQELKRQASASNRKHSFYHFRNRDGEEVDIVIQRGTKLAGVEVKASGTIKKSDFNGLRKLKEAAGKNFASGILFYNGDSVVSHSESLYALPVRKLWEITAD